MTRWSEVVGLEADLDEASWGLFFRRDLRGCRTGL